VFPLRGPIETINGKHTKPNEPILALKLSRSLSFKVYIIIIRFLGKKIDIHITSGNYIFRKV